MAKTYLKLFYDYLEQLEALTMEERGRLMTAMLIYANTGETPEELLTGNERILFPQYRRQIDRDDEAYQRTVEQNRRNAQVRWERSRPSQDASACDRMPSDANRCQEEEKEEEKEKKKEKEHEKEKEQDKDRGQPAPPSLDEVLALCLREKLKTDGHQFWNYYQANGWRDGRLPILDWQAKLREWEHSRRPSAVPPFPQRRPPRQPRPELPPAPLHRRRLSKLLCQFG